MANQNLSQFTEKTLVADADWVFVWDTAGAISKKVSRNSLLNSGTLATSAPVTISQTWNGTGSTVFKALVVDATTPGTTSSSSSLLLDLQVGGVSQCRVNRSGEITSKTVLANGSFLINNSSGYFGGFANGFFAAGDAVIANQGAYIGFAATNNQTTLGADVKLFRDADNTLALRNSTAPQTFRVYNTYTDASNYERGGMAWIGGALHVGVLGTAGAGSPTRALQFVVNNGAAVWNISTGGHFLTNGDNAYDIGASGNFRPRNIYVGSSVFVGTGVDITGAGGIRFPSTGYGPFWAASTTLKNVSNGVLTISNFAENDFGRLQFGGTTSSFPALKRSTTYLQARLADDSAFAPIQGKLTTDTAFTSGAITDTGYIVLYDSTGAAYKVACTPV
jgi:hypothetical protein